MGRVNKRGPRASPNACLSLGTVLGAVLHGPGKKASGEGLNLLPVREEGFISSLASLLLISSFLLDYSKVLFKSNFI